MERRKNETCLQTEVRNITTPVNGIGGVGKGAIRVDKYVDEHLTAFNIFEGDKRKRAGLRTT